MRITIDTDARRLRVGEGEDARELDLYTPEAYAHLARAWKKVGWGMKTSYRYAWMGRPVIQLPEDLVRVQEVLWRLRPDVLVETGIAHGGSLVYYASLFEAFGGGRVIGIDVDIRAHNRAAIEAHPLFHRIELVEGSSVEPATVAQVRERIRPGETVIVILDSNHTKDHVAAELEAYHGLVTPGSYLVVADGLMRDLHDVPGGKPEWRDDHPAAAAAEFLAAHPEFVLDPPRPAFDESRLDADVTYWPDGWLRRR